MYWTSAIDFVCRMCKGEYTVRIQRKWVEFDTKLPTVCTWETFTASSEVMDLLRFNMIIFPWQEKTPGAMTECDNESSDPKQ